MSLHKVAWLKLRRYLRRSKDGWGLYYMRISLEEAQKEADEEQEILRKKNEEISDNIC